MQQGSGLEMLIILAVFGVIFYFMVFRPQSKRQKEQRTYFQALQKEMKSNKRWFNRQNYQSEYRRRKHRDCIK